MKDLMMHYGVSNGIRYTKNQKLFFAKEIEKVVRGKGCNFSLQVSNAMKMNITNMCIGDISKAKIVLACAYDTPSKKFMGKMNYFPFNDKKNVQENLKQITCRYIVFLIITVATYFIFKILGETGISELFQIFMFILSIAISFFVLLDKPNKINFTRNSASIAVAMNLIEVCKAQSNFAIVLLDKSVSSHEGLKLLKDKASGDLEVIILDSIANGSKLVCAHTRDMMCETITRNNHNVEFIDKLYTDKSCNVLSYFRKSLVIASGEIEQNQFVVENTQSKNDYQVNVDRCNEICNILRKYIGGK